MPPAPMPLFDDLLQRLATEHKREVCELRAEIARLTRGQREEQASVPAAKRLGEGPRGAAVNPSDANSKHSDTEVPGMMLLSGAPSSPGSTSTCPCPAPQQVPAIKTAEQQQACSHSGRSTTTTSSERPDEEALAAAFAVATDLRDKDLMDSVVQCTQTTQKPDLEALSLWVKLVEHVRHEVFVAELPKVHDTWIFEDTTGFNFKNLIGVKKADPQGASQHDHLKESDKPLKTVCELAIRSLSFIPQQVPLDPSSKVRMIWDFFGVLLLVHDLIMIPMLVYQTNEFITGLPAGYDTFTDYFDTVSAVFWSCDILLSFLTSYHSTAGFVEKRMYEIAVHYLKSWFIIDFSIVAVDWITIIVFGRATGYMRLGKTASRIMRVTRLLRLVKMSRQAADMMARINSEYVLQIIGLLRLVLLIILLNHYIACFWYGISRLPDPAKHRTWAVEHLFEKGYTSLGYTYFTSLHWSLTQFTPASMEVFPENVYERAFNVVVIICAFGFISSFVSSITNATTHIRNINAQAVARDTQIRRYFAENAVSHGLAARVWLFVRQKRVAAGKRLKTDELPILQQLPVRIRDELKQEVHGPVLMRHPLLAHYLNACPAAFRKIIKKGLQEVTLATGKELKLDAEVKKMIFVVSGSLEFHMSEVVEEQDDQEWTMLEQGRWALEAVLWADKAPFNGHFVAAPGGSDLLLLDSEVFRAVVIENFENFDVLAKYSVLFMDRFRAAMQDESLIHNNVLFNDADAIQALANQIIFPSERRSFPHNFLRSGSGTWAESTSKSIASKSTL